jgi:Gpi18-like mannosyltransferase
MVTTMREFFVRTPLRRAGTALAVAGVIIAAAIAARIPMFDFKSGDYLWCLKKWYDYIAGHGGFLAVRDNFSTHTFSNYNAPYLYLMAGLTYLPVPSLAGIKIVSVAFDLLLAFFAYRIVKLRYPGSWQAVLAATIVLFLPTVATNSALWGQADGIYTAFAVGGVYFLLRDRPWLACTFFGLALAFKLQAVFIFPALLALALARRLPWRTLLAVPAVYVLLDVPLLLAGASWEKLLTVYSQQTEAYKRLTLNAPSAYQWINPVKEQVDAVRSAGVLVAGAVVILLVAILAFRRVDLNSTRIVLLATTSVILVPFLLPAMHERYFYMVDVLSVIAAFYLPARLWYLPIAVQTASFFSYLQYLLKTGSPLDLRHMAGVMGAALLAVLWVTFLEFRRDPSEPTPGGVPQPTDPAPDDLETGAEVPAPTAAAGRVAGG